MKNYFSKLLPKDNNPSSDTPETNSAKDVSKEAIRQRKRRSLLKRVELYFTAGEKSKLKLLANKHGMKLAPFLKACVLAYFDRLFILPDKDVLHRLEVGMRKIGTNINQIAYLCQRQKNVSEYSVVELVEHINQLEELIRNSLTYPDDLESLVKKALKEKPEFAVTLQQLLDNHIEDDN